MSQIRHNHEIHKSVALSTLYRKMRSTLIDTRTLVFYSGNPSASIIFIGEAPGADEDKEGIPFVGKAGRLLTQMLHLAGIERADVGITNVMPFRPPNNRPPSEEECNLYGPYLWEQIRIVDPNVVVALGATSARHFDNTITSLSKVRGIPVDHRNYCVFPTYHPSYMFRRRDLIPSVVDDFRLAKKLDETYELRRSDGQGQKSSLEPNFQGRKSPLEPKFQGRNPTLESKFQRRNPKVVPPMVNPKGGD